LAFASNQLVEYAISISGGNLAEAAKVLGLSLEKLRATLQLYGDD
jgi:DNA-binding NtrC family response regulator